MNRHYRCAACKLNGQRKGDIEADFCGRIPGSNGRCDGRLVVSLRLAHRQDREVATSLDMR